MMNRRSVLRTLGAGLLAAGASSPVTASHNSNGTLRIGAIQSLSGGLGPIGETAMQGFYTGLGLFGANIPQDVTGDNQFTIGDLTVEVLVRDSETRPDRARQRAQQLAADEDVDILVGGTLSPSALGIATAVVPATGVPYMAGPTGIPELTNDADTCSDLVFRASETTAAAPLAGARYIANETGTQSAFIYYPDYDFGQTLADIYQRILEQRGVEVVGMLGLPPGYDNWEGPLQEAVDAGADAAVAGFNAGTLPLMLRTYLQNGDYPFRFYATLGTRFTARAMGEALAASLDPLTATAIDDAGVGPLPTPYQWNQFDNSIAERGNDIHRERYGKNAGAFTSGMFTAATSILQASSETGSTDGQDIAAALRGMTVEATMKGEGKYRFQEYNNQARSPISIAPLVPRESSQEQYWDAPVQPGQPIRVYSMDETTLGPDQVACDLGPASTPPTPDSPTPTPDHSPTTPTPTPVSATPTPQTATPDQSNPTETARPTETPASTATSTSNGNGTSSDDSLFSGTPSETGDLGPLVGLTGVLGGIGATWLANRDEDEE